MGVEYNRRLEKAAPYLLEALKELLEAEWMVTHDWGGDRDAVLKKGRRAVAMVGVIVKYRHIVDEDDIGSPPTDEGDK